MTPARLRLVAGLSLVNAFAVPGLALLGSLAATEGVGLRVLHTLALIAALAVYAATLLALRALLHRRGIYEVDVLIKLLLVIAVVESVLELPWLPGLRAPVREGAVLGMSGVYWLALIPFARRLRRLGDHLHGLRDRLAGALLVAAVGGIALTLVAMPGIAGRESPITDSTPWLLVALVAAFATLIGYARGAIALARIFWREAGA